MATLKKKRARKSEWKGISTGPLDRHASVADIESIRSGFSWGLAHQFQKNLELKDPELASVLGISSRTLTRLRKEAGTLDRVASDRLYRVMRVVELSEKVFENAELGHHWLRRPQYGLGERIPLDLLDTEPGFEAVRTLLLQIEYGVIS